MTEGEPLDASGYHSNFLQAIASAILRLTAVEPKPPTFPTLVFGKH